MSGFWFVAAFGWIGLLAILGMALVPSARAYVNRRPLGPHAPKSSESG